jgi:hypothetical protein
LEIIILHNNRYENELVYSNLKYRFPTYFETTTWRDVLTTEMPNYQILEIQVALRARGYDVDLTNIFDKKTIKAFIEFSKSIGYQQGLQDTNFPLKMLDIEIINQ